MIPIRIPSKKKQSRSGSVKLLDIQPSANKNVPYHSSRRHGSSRSQITNKNLSQVIPQNHLNQKHVKQSNKTKKLSLFSKTYFQSLQNPSKTDLQKLQAKIYKTKQTSKDVSLSTSSLGIKQHIYKLDIHQKKVTSSKKCQKAKKKVNNKSKKENTTKLTKDNICFKKHAKHKSANHTIQYIKMSELDPSPSQACIQNIKINNSAEQNLIYLANEYLIRQKTPFNQKQIITQNLRTVSQKQQTSPEKVTQFIPNDNLEKNKDKICIKTIIDSQLSLKKQIQKFHEQKIGQLKADNFQVQEQLQEFEKKDENLIQYENQKIKNLQKKSLQEQQKIKNQVIQNKLKIAAIQNQCERLKQQKNQILSQYKNQFNKQKKQRQEQRQSIIKKLAIIEQKSLHLTATVTKLQNQNKQLKSQLARLGSQKQKYQRTIKKYENQINQLQNKLETQLVKNKQQNKQLQNLRKQKIYIKQNTQLVLEIVRGQMKQIKQYVPKTENQNVKIYSCIKNCEQKVKTKQIDGNCSPIKRKILSQYNL